MQTSQLRKYVVAGGGWLAFGLTLLFGQGSWFQQQQIRLNEEEHQLALAKQGLEARQKMEELLLQSIKASALYGQLQECDPNDANSRVQNKKFTLAAQLKLLESDFRALEANLATLERRQPRDVQLDFIPPQPPTMVSMEIHVDGRVIPQAPDTSTPPPPPACPPLD